MKQEQKPFEIKEVVSIVAGWPLLYKTLRELSEHCAETDGYSYKNYVVKQIADIAIAANAEIRRLQSELKRKSEACIHFAKANQCFIETINGLKQQLADAPTWGKWVDADQSMKTTVDSVYDVEFKDGHTELCGADRLNSYFSDFIVSTMKIPNKITRFRRLNYEPKPAREVEPPEKKYNLLGHHVTVAEMAEWRGDPDLNMPNIGELARDFLATQAELRELKGER